MLTRLLLNRFMRNVSTFSIECHKLISSDCSSEPWDQIHRNIIYPMQLLHHFGRSCFVKWMFLCLDEVVAIERCSLVLCRLILIQEYDSQWTIKTEHLTICGLLRTVVGEGSCPKLYGSSYRGIWEHSGKIMTQALVSIYKFHITQNYRFKVAIFILISSHQLCMRIYWALSLGRLWPWGDLGFDLFLVVRFVLKLCWNLMSAD